MITQVTSAMSSEFSPTVWDRYAANNSWWVLLGGGYGRCEGVYYLYDTEGYNAQGYDIYGRDRDGFTLEDYRIYGSIFYEIPPNYTLDDIMKELQNQD